MASQIPYLDVQNLTKRFGAQVLFDNISFSIAEGQKVGLVARNGTGKSTLMSVLMDKEGHESGDIIYRRDLKVGYLEQSPQFDPEESVLQACFNHEDDPEKVLEGGGKHRRHIKLASLADIVDKRCEDFLRQARDLQTDLP